MIFKDYIIHFNCMSYQSTKIIELGSCAFRQWRATHSHCRFLHGYQLKAKLWFSGSSLDEKNWIVDFGGLKELKAKLQQVFDNFCFFELHYLHIQLIWDLY